MQTAKALLESPPEGALRCGDTGTAPTFRGFLFDVDFTLIHSWWWPIVLQAFAACYGVELCFYEFLLAKPTVRGLFRWLVEYLAKEGVTVSEFEVERSCWAGMKALTMNPNLASEELAVHREDLEELRARGIALGVVTNRPRQELELTLERLRLRSYFGVTISRDDVLKAKPNPEGILKAVACLGLNPSEVIYFGDSTGDMEAAKAAGVIPVGVINNTFIWDRISLLLREAGAVEVCCLGDFVQCYLYGDC